MFHAPGNILLEQAVHPLSQVAALAGPGRGVNAARSDGAALRGGGEGPELTVTLQLRVGLSVDEVQAAVGHYQQQLAAQPVMAEAVDSIEVRLTA